MPPEGIDPLLDRGQFLFQFVNQHAVSPVHQVQTVLIIPHHREKSINKGRQCCAVRSVTV